MNRIATITLTLIAVAVACTRPVATADRQWTEQTTEVDTPTIVSTQEISSADLLKRLMGADFSIAGSVVVKKIHYQSTYNGKPIYLSGIVALPNDNDTIREIVISNHWTICSDAECPSESWPMDIALCATRRAMVVCADYYGYGLTATQVHPYLDALSTARHSTDCFRAALLLCNSHNTLATNYRTYNIGYSQGGAVALAVQRYIESNVAIDSVARIEKTLCGAGPYDPVACYREYLNVDTLAYPIVVPMIIAGMKLSYPDMFENISESDFFSNEFNTAGISDSVKSKQYTAEQLNSLICNAVGAATPRNIFSVASLDSTSVISQKLLEALELNNLTTGWIPKHRVQFFHSTADVVVPIINTQNALKAFGECPTDSAIIANMGTHNNAAMLFYQQVLQNNIFE